jgi:DNA polymerase III subunit delta'
MPFSVEQALDYLCEAYSKGRLAHAFLVSGPEGSGKLRLTRDLFQTINGETARAADFHQIEPESKSRKILVEQIRELEGHLRMSTAGSRAKFGVVLEADRLMPQAANAFLKTLEEPPERSVLVLVTALPDALLATIQSRCIHVPLRSAASAVLTEEETFLVRELSEIVVTSGFSIISALLLARVFQEALQRSRARIESEHGELLKRDRAVYKQTTDGAWLEQREQRLATLTESRYVKARANLVLRMIEWLGDVLRIKVGSNQLDLPEHRIAATTLAGRYSTTELTRRLGALESLADLFSKNIQESLAIEAVFLKTFGPSRLERNRRAP